jgi:hypothetical protein
LHWHVQAEVAERQEAKGGALTAMVMELLHLLGRAA